MNLDGIIEDYPNTTTPLSKAVLTNLANAILGVAFPIGKIEMFYDAEDHSNYMGFTWERTAVGKVLVGIDSTDTDFNTIGKTGGKKTHTLTVDEIPAHEHDEYFITNDGNINQAITGNSGSINGTYAKLEDSFEQNRAPLVTGIVGGSQPHNNLQPYQVVAYWKRVG